MGALEQLLERNRKAARVIAPSSKLPALCLIACDDAALTRRLEESLGLETGDAVVLRLPGAGAALPVELLQKAVAKAVLLDGCEEVLLLGHSGCSLSRVSANTVAEALERAGVPRGAVPFDLRELVCAGQDPRAGLRAAAEALRRTEFLPDALLVHLAELDDASGTLKILEHGGQHRVTRRKGTDPARVAGYQGGPMELAEVAPPLPVAATGAAPTGGFDVTVMLPEVTTILQRADVTPLSSDVRDAVPQDIVTAAELFRNPPAAAVARPPPEPLPRGRGAGGALRPELTAAMNKVRVFLASEVAADARRLTARELQQAAADGATADALVNIALRPVLQSGSNRYKVIDELLLIKEAVLKLPRAKAGSVLEELYP